MTTARTPEWPSANTCARSKIIPRTSGTPRFGPTPVEVHFNDQDYILTESLKANVQTIALAGGGWAVSWTETSFEDGDILLNVFGRIFAADGSQARVRTV